MKNRIGSLLLLIVLALMLKPGVALAYYDPELGRFIQPDTIIPDLSNPQSYNRYSYCVNNPLRYTDPTGHAWYDSVPLIGPGVEQISGNAGLEAMSQRAGYISYSQARQSLGIGVATAGNVSMVDGIGKVTAGATHATIASGQEIATAGIATGVIVLRSGAQTAARATEAGAAETAATTGQGAQQLYKIDNGVRRSVAANLTGKETIPAAIKQAGQPDKIMDVPISSLRSPKTELPVDSRFINNNLKPAQSGSRPPPIEIAPINGELPGHVPVSDVKLVPPEH
jgi:hypothetical protein